MSEVGPSSLATQSDERESATAADWLAVGAGTVGALMALMDVSIVNASLPTIQGEIGATPSEGTWVGTAYLISEIVAIPLTPWLLRLFGMRTLLLTAAGFFTAFSVLCGFATDLPTMIFGRVGQGLAGGALIPTALTIVATRLPARQQSIGLAITAMAALLGPVTGPLLGGWLTENVSWHLAFFINVPVCVVQATMIVIAIPSSRPNWQEARNADWLGIAGMSIALGAITTLLEEGHREHWFDSPLIWQLAIASGIGACLVAIGQWRAPQPVLRLGMLRNPKIAAPIALMAAIGMLLFSTLFITPQFLAAIASYNALQAGQVAFLSGIAAIPTAFLYPLLAGRLDTRLIVAIAVLSVALGAYLAARLTVDSAGGEFLATQLLFGIGTTLTAIPIQQSLILAAPDDAASEASSLISVARNLGGSVGLAAIASFQDQRLELHRWQLHESLPANDPAVQQHVASAASLFGGGPEGLEAGYRILDGQVLLQAHVMTFNDMFLAMACIGLLVTPLVLLLRPVTGNVATAVH